MHGGKRSGSGRPKGDGSKVIRVPLGCLHHVEAVIASFKSGDSSFLENPYKGSQVKSKELDNGTIKRNDFLYYKRKYESLPRAYRRSLMKKYKSIEPIVKHLIETNEQDLNMKT